MTTLIEQLASAKGIANDYVDAWGNPAQVTLESKAAMLAAMGYKVDDEVALQAQLEEEKHQHWQRPLDPVVVVRTGESITLELRLPIELVNTSKAEVTIESLSNGGAVEATYEIIPTATGANWRVRGTSTVKVPLLGRKIETYVVDSLLRAYANEAQEISAAGVRIGA